MASSIQAWLAVATAAVALLLALIKLLEKFKRP
jgi:hypothetical protein